MSSNAVKKKIKRCSHFGNSYGKCKFIFLNQSFLSIPILLPKVPNTMWLCHYLRSSIPAIFKANKDRRSLDINEINKTVGHRHDGWQLQMAIKGIMVYESDWCWDCYSAKNQKGTAAHIFCAVAPKRQNGASLSFQTPRSCTIFNQQVRFKILK